MDEDRELFEYIARKGKGKGKGWDKGQGKSDKNGWDNGKGEKGGAYKGSKGNQEGKGAQWGGWEDESRQRGKGKGDEENARWGKGKGWGEGKGAQQGGWGAENTQREGKGWGEGKGVQREDRKNENRQWGKGQWKGDREDVQRGWNDSNKGSRWGGGKGAQWRDEGDAQEGARWREGKGAQQWDEGKGTQWGKGNQWEGKGNQWDGKGGNWEGRGSQGYKGNRGGWEGKGKGKGYNERDADEVSHRGSKGHADVSDVGSYRRTESHASGDTDMMLEPAPSEVSFRSSRGPDTESRVSDNEGWGWASAFGDSDVSSQQGMPHMGRDMRDRGLNDDVSSVASGGSKGYKGYGFHAALQPQGQPRPEPVRRGPIFEPRRYENKNRDILIKHNADYNNGLLWLAKLDDNNLLFSTICKDLPLVRGVLRAKVPSHDKVCAQLMEIYSHALQEGNIKTQNAVAALKAVAQRPFCDYLQAKIISENPHDKAANVLCAVCRVRPDLLQLGDLKRITERFKGGHIGLQQLCAEMNGEREVHVDAGQYTFLDVDVDSFDDIYDEVAEPSAAEVDGEVSSLLWHFNTQFHLLREDFLGPLRSGMHSLGKQTTNDIWFDQGVTITGMGTSISGVVFRVCIPKKGPRSFQRDRLKTGSLLCFSDRKFEKGSLIWATVQGGRNSVEMTSTQVTFSARFPKYSADMEIGSMYDMIESTAFFEAFSHVLRGIQNSEIEHLPFQHILLARPDALASIPWPELLEGEDIVLNSLLFPGQPELLWDGADPVPEITPDMSSIDEAQYESVINALTHEVSVIQGPPGTGKTYVGLKIIEVLLDTLWGQDRGKGAMEEDIFSFDEEARCPPIVIMCFTNHALDSVLVDLLNGIETNVVRIGGSTKDDTIKRHNIMELIHTLPRTYKLKDLRHRMRRLATEISESCAELSIENLLTDPHTEIPDEAREYIKGKKAEYVAELKKVQDELDKNEKAIKDLGAFTVEACEIRKKDKGLKKELVRLLQCELCPFEAWLDGDDFRAAVEERAQEDDEDRVHGGRLGGDYMEQLLAVNGVNDYGELSVRDRYAHFDNWTYDARTHVKELVRTNCRAYEELNQQRIIEETQAARRILSKARIVGATTTGCAKHCKMLEELRPEIIIVEEAAEVLESHVLSVLSPSAKHLILIGDHKQLQPKVNCMDMQKKNLCVSLMERLVRSGMQPSMLRTQRRMTEEICTLTSRFYPEEILTHPNTKKHPQEVKGIVQPLFFINHDKSESKEEGSSPYNEYEAHYAVALAWYLVQQGYDPSQIVVLLPYKGQRNRIMDLVKEHEHNPTLSNVRVACVDNFQGEEADIIILTLVRTQGWRNFLKKENRLIVALSRARWGMYVIANFDFMRGVSPEWKSVIDHAKDRGIIDSTLKLKCQSHENEIDIADPRDFFSKCPEGGCKELCSVRMDCGHPCRQMCHPLSAPHLDCKEKCGRTGDSCNPPRTCEHRCNKKCFEECGPCDEPVEAVLPCGHKQRIKCHQNPANVQCNTFCIKILPGCRHRCRRKCGEPCTEKCKERVKKELLCGHKQEAECHVDPARIRCKTPCGSHLACDHPCQNSCGTCDKGAYTLHRQCLEECNRILVCGHYCHSVCSKMCPPCRKNCIMRCSHSRCKSSCSKPCAKCPERCNWACEHHKCSNQCWEACDREKCDERCTKKLPCGHQCKGYCGDKCPKWCHDESCNIGEHEDILMIGKPKEEDLMVELACGHIFLGEAFDSHVRAKVESEKIQWIGCPTCRRPITPFDTGRYRREVNMSILSVNKARERTLSADEAYSEEKNRLMTLLQAGRGEENEVDYLLQRVKQCTYDDLGALRRQVDLMQWAAPFRRMFSQYGDKGVAAKKIVEEMLMTVAGEEDVKKAVMEIRDLVMGGRFYALLISCKDPDDTKLVVSVREKYQQGERTEAAMVMWEETVYDLEKKISENPVKAMKMASEALGFGPGHWFKCPNGHLYIIADCGGAVMEAKCPECGATIGGTGHALNQDNTWAGGDIGGVAPAWPTLYR